MANTDMGMMAERMPPEDDMMEGESGSDNEEQASVFLSKSALGGKKCKPGDTITLKVQDVDPESGDVEAVLSGYGESSGESKGYEADFDRAMPPEEDEG